MSDVLSSRPAPSRRRHGRSSSAAIIDVRSFQRSQSYPRPNSSGGRPLCVEDLIADTPGASSSRRAAATRIVSTMRRPFGTSKKRDQSPMDSGMYSTPEESRPPVPSPYSVRDAPRPTIQQIAMGLHISRTPHLRPPRSESPTASPRGRSSSQPFQAFNKRSTTNVSSRSTPVMLPPPPPRSSMKKPGSPTKSPASASLPPSSSDLSLTGSTLTMSAPPTPSARNHRSASVSIFPTRLQMSVSRILRVPSRKESPTATPPLRADDDSTSSMSSGASPRKMVRFSSSPVVPQVEFAS